MKDKRIKLVAVVVGIYLVVMAIVFLQSGKEAEKVDLYQYATLDETTSISMLEAESETTMSAGESSESGNYAAGENKEESSPRENSVVESSDREHNDVGGSERENPTVVQVSSPAQNITKPTSQVAKKEETTTTGKAYQVSGSISTSSSSANLPSQNNSVSGDLQPGNQTTETTSSKSQTSGNSASLNYKYYEQQKMCVVAAGSTATGSLVIPQTVQKDGITYTVAGIANEAFLDCRQLEHVQMPDTITYIGAKAFENCYALTSVKLSQALTSIEYWAFYNCISLTEISLPSTLTNLGNEVFADCTALTTVHATGTAATLASQQYNASQYQIVN